MTNIDREIELAKRKPLTSETLNYIGDLCLKKGDRERAVAYYFEAVDKLHFAQKEKKMAICKKIIKISPNSERAYEGIIEVLSKMGLVIEEKKYLHMLARICEEKGDRDKAEELYARIKELDPHVSIPGTFFYRHQESTEPQTSPPEQASRELPKQQGGEEPSAEGYRGPAESADKTPPGIPSDDQEKLIEASLEEISEETPILSKKIKRGIRIPKQRIFLAALAVIIAALLIFFAVRERRGTGRSVNLPYSGTFDNIEVHADLMKDLDEISSVVPSRLTGDLSFISFSLRAVDGCMPDSFASLSPGMISLLDQWGNATELKTVEGLQKLSKIIYKSNVCGKENGVVFVRLIIPVRSGISYSGIALSVPEKDEPVLLKWSVQ